MEDYNKIIESLGVKFGKARHINILQPITIKNFYDVENTLLSIIEKYGNKSPEGAKEYLEEMEGEGRYEKDVY